MLVFAVSSTVNTWVKVPFISLPEFMQIPGQPLLSEEKKQMCPVNHIRMWNTSKLKPGMICYQEIQAELYLGFWVTLYFIWRTVTHAFSALISTKSHVHFPENALWIYARNLNILNSGYFCCRQEKNRTKTNACVVKNVEFLHSFLPKSVA